MCPSLRIVSILLILTSAGPAVYAANQARAMAPTLLQLTQRSGTIFAGTVLSVERMTSKAANEVETVQIRFQVDQAIRGVSPQQVLAIREWIGLWNAGDRYRVGERLLLFLYPSSKLGLTSPVAGLFGRFQLDARGQVLIQQARLAELRSGLRIKLPPRIELMRVDGSKFVRAIRRLGAQ
jgi:hypothetical protein